METKDIVLNIMKETMPTKDLQGVEDIIDGGYIDSLELLGLITELTERLKIDIDIDDMTPENFNSVDAIAALIERKRS